MEAEKQIKPVTGNKVANFPAIVEQREVDVAMLNGYLQTVGNNIPHGKVESFLQVCKAFNLNPFLREIYMLAYFNKRTGKHQYTVIVGFEVYLKRAERSGRLDGWSAGIKKEGNEIYGWVQIHRKDWKHPFYLQVRAAEYRQNNKMWKEKPDTMIEKVAIGQGFRRCFPTELGGMPYTSEELGNEIETKELPGPGQTRPANSTDKKGEILENEKNSSEILENEKTNQQPGKFNGPTLGGFILALNRAKTTAELEQHIEDNKGLWLEQYSAKSEEIARLQKICAEIRTRFDKKRI